MAINDGHSVPHNGDVTAASRMTTYAGNDVANNRHYKLFACCTFAAAAYVFLFTTSAAMNVTSSVTMFLLTYFVTLPVCYIMVNKIAWGRRHLLYIFTLSFPIYFTLRCALGHAQDGSTILLVTIAVFIAIFGSVFVYTAILVGPQTHEELSLEQKVERNTQAETICKSLSAFCVFTCIAVIVRDRLDLDIVTFIFLLTNMGYFVVAMCEHLYEKKHTLFIGYCISLPFVSFSLLLVMEVSSYTHRHISFWACVLFYVSNIIHVVVVTYTLLEPESGYHNVEDDENIAYEV